MRTHLVRRYVGVVAILVDQARWTFREHLWCHLVSDVSLAELHAFAADLALPTRLFHGDHYDLPEVYRADEVFCTGTMGELAAVTEIDGRTIGSDQIGGMTERLSALYGMRTAKEGFEILG